MAEKGRGGSVTPPPPTQQKARSKVRPRAVGQAILFALWVEELRPERAPPTCRATRAGGRAGPRDRFPAPGPALPLMHPLRLQSPWNGGPSSWCPEGELCIQWDEECQHALQRSMQESVLGLGVTVKHLKFSQAFELVVTCSLVSPW